MTTVLERARSRKPITWLTLIGVLLLPVVIGGILVAALYNPVERLDGMQAAIVNDDEPVTIDDQLVPLGRQLTAGLVEGADDQPSNLDWTISNADDAAEGLADGTYAAVITIPANFSAAATSTRPGETPEKATIQVQTPPDSLIVDDAITAQVASAAASVMGQQLSSVYLENVFLGFTTLGDQLGTAASGASELASGATSAADGADQLAAGFPQLSSGASGLASGATALQSGLGQLAGGARGAASGADQLAAGVNAGADQLVATGLVPSQVSDVAGTSSQAASGVLALAQQCVANGGDPTYCQNLVTAATGSQQAAAGTVTALGGFSTAGAQTIAGQFRTIAGNITALGAGVTQVAGGIDQSAAGAGQLASGASQLAGGIDQAGTGAVSLADGVRQLADGTGELASGLQTAVEQVPSYSGSEASTLADVVANPVEAEGVGTSLFGASAIPLLAMLALWFGGLGTFIALQAVSRRALSAREPSVALAFRSFLPAAALGAAQGLLVAGVVQIAASYDWGQWWAFAGIAVVAGVAFAAVNQALVAVFSGAGRWIAALVGVLAIATGVVSTAPGALSGLASLMPTAPAYHGMVAALTSAGGFGAAVAGLIIWAALAFGATILAVARRRTTSARALLKSSPVPA
ncbi:YhgE/Pip family protein [Microbacterium sp.]|uniref:YhgE/Pip domain-containing protein n=1 Tax=Microbacterium sp. TaxID=51671 RepID=UPI003F70DD1A